MMNEILITSLQVQSHIGVEATEREKLQQLHVNLCIQPPVCFSHMNDDVRQTIDYMVVANRVKELAAGKPRFLIETLASDISRLLVEEFQAASVTVEVRKFVLPEAAYVAVRHHLKG